MEAETWMTQKTLLLAAGAFAAGAISTWILIGAESGSRADWVAAAGTWVIGYGAWKYSREAHLLREREIKRETDRDRYMHVGRVQAMKEWAKILRRPQKVIAELLAKDGNDLPTGYVRGAVKGLKDLLKLIPLDDEAWRYLAKDDVALKMSITTYIVHVNAECDALLERSAESSPDAAISTVKRSRWPEIRDIVKSLAETGRKLDLAADAIPEI